MIDTWAVEPAKTCQKHMIYEEAVRGRPGQALIKWRPCGQPAGSSMFCKAHSYCQDLLDLAAKLDYPAFVAMYVRNCDGQPEPYVTIGAGAGGWKAYAVCHSMRHHRDLLARLENALRSQRIAVTVEAA